MKTMVRSQFLPSDLAIQIKMRRNNLRQRDLDIMSYTEQFHTLRIRGGAKDEDEKVVRYINGLKYNIQDEIGLNMPRTLGECFQLAVRAEEKLKRKNERQGYNRGGGSMRGRGGRTNQTWEEKDKDKGTTSELRGGYNHRGGRFGGGRGSGTFQGKCFNFNEVGHKSFRCPKWIESDKGKERRVGLTQEEERKEDSGPVLAYPEIEGKFFIVRQGEQVQEPKVNIFRTYCLSKGKLCQFIIDSGSHNKLVLVDMVTKLGLTIADHPNPYKAPWFYQVLNVEVSQRALVNFLIGSYHDQVMCDIIPMSCGHIILVRPW